MMTGPFILYNLFQMSFSPHTAVYNYVKIIASLLFIVLTCSGLYMVCAIVGWQYGIGYFLFLIAEVTYLSCLSVVYVVGTYVCVCICMCVFMCVYISACLYCVCVCAYMCLCGCICVCMCVHLCVMCVCLYGCICVSAVVVWQYGIS